MGREVRGIRRRNGTVQVRVWENGVRCGTLNKGLAVRRHSPSGFEWGYAGSGPAQLALALCLWATGDIPRSEAVYRDVKWHLVAQLPLHAWTLTHQQVMAAVIAYEDEGVDGK